MVLAHLFMRKHPFEEWSNLARIEGWAMSRRNGCPPVELLGHAVTLGRETAQAGDLAFHALLDAAPATYPTSMARASIFDPRPLPALVVGA